jgi:hypothetical protein
VDVELPPMFVYANKSCAQQTEALGTAVTLRLVFWRYPVRVSARAPSIVSHFTWFTSGEYRHSSVIALASPFMSFTVHRA